MLHLGMQSFVANRHGRQDRKGNMLGTCCSPKILIIGSYAETHQSILWQTSLPHSRLDITDIPPHPS